MKNKKRFSGNIILLIVIVIVLVVTALAFCAAYLVQKHDILPQFFLENTKNAAIN